MKRKIKVRKVLANLVFLAVILVISFPFFWIIITSFKKHIAIMMIRFLFTPTFDNYLDLFFLKGSDFPKYLLNSTIVATSATFIIVSIASLAAYAMSRSEFLWNVDKIVLGWVLFLRMIFPVALALPFYKMAKFLGLYNTKTILIMFYTVINIPFAVWMLKGFFDELPRAYEESAFIDGCSVFGAFWRIALPIISSGVGATAIFVFLLSWNEYLFALVMTDTDAAMTFPVGMAGLAQEYMVEWGQMAAAATIFTIPIFIFAMLTQDYLARGLTFGMGIKG